MDAYWYDVAEYDYDDSVVYQYATTTGTVGEIQYRDSQYDTGITFDIFHGPAPLDWCIESQYDWCYPLPR